MRPRLALVGVFALGWVVGCSDTPTDTSIVVPPPTGGLVVSDPGPAPLASAMRAGVLLPAGSPGDSVVYVSLAPKTVPIGVTATLTNLASGRAVTTALQDGGFDPAPVTAKIGDAIEVVVRDGSGAIVADPRTLVAARSAPVVVRTSPAHRKRDVALNCIISVVFSEPVAGGSVTSSSVKLFRGTTLVAGTASLLQGTATAAVFRPNAPLDPNTDYRLEVTPAVRDLQGDALAAALTVTFTTGTTSLGSVDSVHVQPDTIAVALGSQVQLVASALTIIRDSFSLTTAPVEGYPTLWSSDNPAVAAVSDNGLVTPLAAGVAIIRAIVAQRTGAAVVFVTATLAPVNSVEVTPGTGTRPVTDRIELTAVPRDASGNILTFRAITWRTSDPTIATVDPGSGGKTTVTGVGPGTATITATSEGKSGTATITFVAAGAYRQLALNRSSCGVTTLGWAMCWGMNHEGELGTGAFLPDSVPRAVAGGLAFSQISLGGYADHTCAITTTGAAYCWGNNRWGKLGIGNDAGLPRCAYGDPCTNAPLPVAGGRVFTAIGAGGAHSCALESGGTVYCWGLNDQGQLGLGTTTGPETCGVPTNCSTVPRAVSGGLTFATLDVGGDHTCALTAAGVAYCWGANTFGQLGVGTTALSAAPVPVAGGHAFVTITAGLSHSCGLTADGSAWCWGLNGSGQLGNGSLAPSTTPVAVAGGLTFAALSAHGYSAHTCGVTTAGVAYCWGYNGRGQLGNGSATDSPTPVPVSGGLVFSNISTGIDESCGVTVAQVAYCWGVGWLGNGSSAGSTVPVRVAGQP